MLSMTGGNEKEQEQKQAGIMPTCWAPGWQDFFQIFSNRRKENSRKCHGSTDDDILFCRSNQGNFTWILRNFSKLNVYYYRSDRFEVGGSRWYVSLYPRGVGAHALSVCLEVADAFLLPFGWSRSAYFELSVVNQLYPKATLKSGTRQKFTARQSCWGFQSLIPLQELCDASKGYLLNDTLMLEVDVKVLEVNHLRYACELPKANCKEETTKKETDEEEMISTDEEETDEEMDWDFLTRLFEETNKEEADEHEVSSPLNH